MSFARPEPFDSSLEDKLVGLFIIAALAIVFWLTVLKDEMDNKSADNLMFSTILSQSYGIKKGASVSISGVAIGSIEEVNLTNTGQVEVEVSLSRDFEQFYTQDSELLVESGIGLNTVLSGAGLVFRTGGIDKPKLSGGELLNAVEPKSIDQMLDEWNVQEIAKNVANIVENIDKVVAVLGDGQAQLTSTLNDTSQVMKSIVDTSARLPTLIDNVNSIAENSNSLLVKIDQQYENSNDEIQQLLVSANSLTRDLNDLIVNLNKTAELSPVLIDNLSTTSNRMTLLLTKLNNHWILGGGGQQAETTSLPIQLNDSQLYKEETVSK